MKPRYPIFIPTKGRYKNPYMADCLVDEGVPFRVVVEEPERTIYEARYGKNHVLTLPTRDRGLVFARNWIRDFAQREGSKRHWQLDDNIRGFWRYHRGERIPCDAGTALRVCEDFSDRYQNVALSGLEYETFARGQRTPPFRVNTRVYSCSLVLNEMPFRWRLRYNDDTDLCLQIVSSGWWCTVLVCAFLAQKSATMTVRGGNTDDLYLDDGRLKMARELERLWPGVVKVGHRFGRAQHVVRYSWKRFRHPLVLRDDVDLDALPETDEYGLELKELEPVDHPRLRRFIEQVRTEQGEESDTP